jgi:hypothetical protein
VILYLCVLEISISFCDFVFDVGIFPTVWYFCPFNYHNHIRPSFMTYHRGFTTLRVTRRVSLVELELTANFSGEHEFAPVFIYINGVRARHLLKLEVFMFEFVVLYATIST